MLVGFKDDRMNDLPVLYVNDASVLLLMLCEQFGLGTAETCDLRRKRQWNGRKDFYCVGGCKRT